MTTYKRIGTVKTTLDILKFLSNQREPVSGKEVATALDVPHGTCMCYLATLADSGVVRQTREYFELGMGMAVFWAKVKSKKEAERQNVNRELEILETGSDMSKNY